MNKRMIVLLAILLGFTATAFAQAPAATFTPAAPTAASHGNKANKVRVNHHKHQKHHHQQASKSAAPAK